MYSCNLARPQQAPNTKQLLSMEIPLGESEKIQGQVVIAKRQRRKKGCSEDGATELHQPLQQIPATHPIHKYAFIMTLIYPSLNDF